MNPNPDKILWNHWYKQEDWDYLARRPNEPQKPTGF